MTERYAKLAKQHIARTSESLIARSRQSDSAIVSNRFEAAAWGPPWLVTSISRPGWRSFLRASFGHLAARSAPNLALRLGISAIDGHIPCRFERKPTFPPGIVSAFEGTDAGDSHRAKIERRTGTGGFVWSRAIKNDIAIARNLGMVQG